MTDDRQPGPAGRFLHVCYTCADDAPVIDFFETGLGLRATMRTPLEPVDGAILGFEGPITVAATFLYDGRGPRTSPAIEVQRWADPPLTGAPLDDPTHAGVHALGIAVPELDAALARVSSFAVTVLGTSDHSPFEGGRAAVIRDSRGITLDLVEDPGVAEGASRLRHLRVTCSDAERSRRWCEGLGFTAIGHEKVAAGRLFGPGQRAGATLHRLRLSEEPFELILTDWGPSPVSGAHYGAANHAGLYRAALRVDDTAAAVGALTAAGWTIDRGPLNVSMNGTPVPDLWIAFLHDPDGIPYELVQRPATLFR